MRLVSGSRQPCQRNWIADPHLWNGALDQLPAAHILQSWEWGDFKARHGWQADRLVWGTPEAPRAAAQVLSRPLPILGLQLMYVPKGPTLDYDDASLLQTVLADLEGLVREQRGLFLKLDPDVPVDTPTGKKVVSLLKQRSWQPSREQIQFRNTSVIDLQRNPDDILSLMKSKWRYNIRLAKRRGVVVRLGTIEDLPLLYEMYEETSQRQRFVIRPESYYVDAWGSFIRDGLAQPLIAQVGEEPVAMVILFHFGQQAWYMYGGSRVAHRESMPNHLLQWEAMLWARDKGYKVYDLWGAPDVLDGSDRMAGVHRFKMGFGARLACHIGAYDYPTTRFGYWFYAVAVPRMLALMRWRHWQSQT